MFSGLSTSSISMKDSYNQSDVKVYLQVMKVNGHRPSANLRQGGKKFTVLLYSFLLSDRVNSGFTCYITPGRYAQS